MIIPPPTTKLFAHLDKLLKVQLYKHCGEWAYHNRILPPENAEPGRFRIERTPYFVEVAEALNDPNYEVVTVMCGTQQAKSEMCFNYIGHRMDTRAQPAIFVFPTQKLADSVSQTRFSKLLQSSESLSLKHQKGKSDKISLKIIGGAPLIFAYATSASQLCSHACATACLDEYDRMPDNVEGEGNPLELILARLSTYPNGKCLVTSTPTLTQLSPIYKLFKEGTAAKYHISCPHCKEWFLPCFEHFKWDNDDYEKVSRAWFECNHCHGEIGEEHRAHFTNLENVKYWTIENDGSLVDWRTKNNKNASFWASGAMSPWRNFLKCAIRWLKAVASGSESRKQGVMNTVFGEPYEGKGEAPPADAVKDCRLAYKMGQLKRAYSDVLFMTVDVQKDCLYYVIRGWSTTSKSALVDRGFIYGDTDKTTVWNKLHRLSKKTWGKYPINYTFIDAGYRTAYVYAFCKQHGSNYIPVIGRERQRSPIASSKVEINLRGKRFRYGLTLFTLDDGYFKEMLYTRIREGGKSWFVPYDIDDEYCKQVTAESLLTDGIRKKWVLKYKHNHFLDCEKMQLFACTLFRIDLAGDDVEEKEGQIDGGQTKEDVVESEHDKLEKLITNSAKLGAAISPILGKKLEENEVEEGVRNHLKKLCKEQVDIEQNKRKVREIENRSKSRDTNVMKILNDKSNIGVNVFS